MTSSPVSHRRSMPVPGLGSVRLDAADRHPVLVWLAGGGLLLAAVLAVFGMPPIDIHAPTHGWGIMSPTCGMTRGVAAATRGDLAAAWAYNPASLLLVGGAVAGIARTVFGLVAGRWVNVRVDITRRGWIGLAVALVALEINQQAHAALLMAG